MSKAITVLETLACSPDAVHDPDLLSDVEALEEAARIAIAQRNPKALVAALGGREQMFCSVWAPDSDDQIPDEQPLAPEDEPDTDETRAA